MGAAVSSASELVDDDAASVVQDTRTESDNIEFSLMRTLYAGERGTTSLAFAPNSDSLAVAIYDVRDIGSNYAIGDGKVYVYDTTGGREQILDEAPAPPGSVSWDPNDEYLAAGGQGGQLYLYDVSSWNVVEERSLSTVVSDVAFGPKGDYLGVATSDGVYVYDADDWSVTAQLWHASSPSIAFSPDGNYLAAGNTRDDKVFVYDTGNWGRIETVVSLADDGGAPLAFSPDGDYLAAGTRDETVYVIDTDDWSTTETLTYAESTDAVKYPTSITWSPEGNYLAFGTFDNNYVDGYGMNGSEVYVYDVSNWNIIDRLNDPVETVGSVSFSMNGDYLAAGSFEGAYTVSPRVYIYEISTPVSVSNVTVPETPTNNTTQPVLFNTPSYLDGVTCDATGANTAWTCDVATGECSPDSMADGNHTVTVTCTDGNGQSDSGNTTVTVDTQHPNITCGDTCHSPEPVKSGSDAVFDPGVDPGPSGVEEMAVCTDASCSATYCTTGNASTRCAWSTPRQVADDFEYFVRVEDNVGHVTVVDSQGSIAGRDTDELAPWTMSVRKWIDARCESDSECLIGGCEADPVTGEQTCQIPVIPEPGITLR